MHFKCLITAVCLLRVAEIMNINSLPARVNGNVTFLLPLMSVGRSVCHNLHFHAPIVALVLYMKYVVVY